MIHVLAEIRLRSGARDRFITEFRLLEPFVRAEAGCIEYAGAIDTATAIRAQAPVRDDVVMVIEKWENEVALALHLEAPHMLAYRERVRDFVERTIIHVLEPV
jgi:quinol monooxygenase YgiN